MAENKVWGAGESNALENTSGVDNGRGQVASNQKRPSGDQSEGLIGQLRSSAGDALQTAKTNAASKIDEQRTGITSGLSNVAGSVRQIGQELSNAADADPLTKFAADYSEAAADKLETVAGYFDSHDLSAIYSDVQGLARRHPAAFIGGAFALGFLASRLFKSTSPTPSMSAGKSFRNTERGQEKTYANAAA